MYNSDGNGNLLSDGTHSFQYDTANRLTVASQQSTVYSYTYNGVGDRLSQAVGGTTTRYALDPAAGLPQVLSDGTSTYLYGLGRIGQQQTNIQYFGSDAVGSVRQQYNSSGQIVANQRFDPFGNLISQTGTNASLYGFAGEPQDSTGLDYFRARYYDPATGRFISQDPWGGDLQQPDTLNGWSYAENNPVLFTDASGMCNGGVGFARIWSGLNTPLFEGGWDQVKAGFSEAGQQCQENWNKAEAAWTSGDYGRAVAWGTGTTTALQRAAGWVYENNRDWAALRDPCVSGADQEGARLRIMGRGFELAAWLVPIGIGAKSVLGKTALAKSVLTEGGCKAETAVVRAARHRSGV